MATIPMPPGEDVYLMGEVVTLGVRRCPDGSVVFAMGPIAEDNTSYAMIVTPDNVMKLIDFIVNRPAGAPN